MFESFILALSLIKDLWLFQFSQTLAILLMFAETHLVLLPSYLGTQTLQLALDSF
jgi:hypothetical protein